MSKENLGGKTVVIHGCLLNRVPSPKSRSNSSTVQSPEWVVSTASSRVIFAPAMPAVKPDLKDAYATHDGIPLFRRGHAGL